MLMSQNAGLCIFHLRFVLEARDPITFGRQAGAQLRGALYEALRVQHCAMSDSASGHMPQHAAHCPVCWLVAREDPAAQRGKDVPRPFSIRPPSDALSNYPRGCRVQFGVSLFGAQALSLLPYIMLAVPHMGEMGIGSTRGRFALRAVEGVNLLTDGYEILMQPTYRAVRQPRLWVDAAQIETASQRRSPQWLTVRFITPTRLMDKGEPAKRPDFSILLARTLERVDALQIEYGDATAVSPHEALMAAAKGIRLAQDNTQWQEIFSHSARAQSYSPISGITGEATYEGDLGQFLPWLLWGQCVQVGKNAVKGNGIVQIVL